MRKTIIGLLTIAVLLLAACKQRETDGQSGSLKGTITISGAWALYPMTLKWKEEFKKIYPAVRFDISAGGAGKGMADALADAVDIGLVSREVYPEEIEKGAFWTSVTKDAVVPVASGKNPFIKELLNRGITKQGFTDIWIKGTATDWSDTVLTVAPERKSGKTTINVYTRSDACGAAETWAKYLGYHQEDLLGVGVYGDPGIAEAVRKDRQGIGYNNINFAYDANTKKPVKGLAIIPIDLNANGQIDDSEQFYRTRDEIARAIAEGTYPSPPARPLHFVTLGRPKRAVVTRFIEWVLTDGQQYVQEAGYVALSAETLEAELKKLREE